MAHILKLYEYIIFGQIIFQNFHQFKAFAGLSDCRTIGPSDYRTVGLSDYSYGPLLIVLDTRKINSHGTLCLLMIQKQKNIASDIFSRTSGADSMVIQMTDPIYRQIRPKK